MAKYLMIFCFLALVHYNFALKPNSKQNFCQQNRCLTCIGRYCTTTCEGKSCKGCPLGDCCNGNNCNICRGANCCNSAECNSCISNCLKECQGQSTCHYDCFKKCHPNPEKIIDDLGSKYPIISNSNYLPVNVTTVINITNLIKSENSVYNPIIINSTNFNNYTHHRGNYHKKQVVISDNIAPPTTKDNRTCCEIVHPEICQNVKGKDSPVCYIRKHKECSELCTSQHVHIVESDTENNNCVTIANPPYFFCGKYVTENCDNCYNCTDVGVIQCSKKENCSDNCRKTIISESFYNTLYRKN